MNARPSKYGLPTGLSYDSSTKRYVFTLVNGKRKTIGEGSKTKAINLANAYNAQMRSNSALSKLLGEDDVVIPFDKIARKILERETLSRDVQRELNNNMKRAREFFTMTVDSIDRKTCQDYLKRYHSNIKGDAFNKKIGFLVKLFNYVLNLGLMETNPAKGIMKDPKLAKVRKRLTLEQFKVIREACPLWLQTAMNLSLQTTHARLEITRIEYRLRKPSDTRNGCYWFDKPVNGIYGTLYLNRQKVIGNEEAHVAIPIGEEIKRIIDNSKDKILCPYVVHREPDKRAKAVSENCTHPNQIAPDYLSKAFRQFRDSTGIFDNIPSEQRPTFHEIRALSSKLFEDMGVNPQARMAHKDERSTKVYTSNHVKFVEVPHAEIKVS